MRELDRGSGKGLKGMFKSNPSSEDSKSNNGLSKRKKSQEKSPLVEVPRSIAGVMATSEPDQLLTNEEDYQVFNQLFATPKIPSHR